MTIHKRTKLTPLLRKALVGDYWKKHLSIRELKLKYRISAPTVYKIIRRARNNDCSVHKSVNKRFRCLEYGIKRLSKVEKKLEEQLKQKARRYNKKYPGEMIHFDTKRLPLLAGESKSQSREYLFVAIDDFSGIIQPDLTVLLLVSSDVQAKRFLERGMSIGDRRMANRQLELAKEFKKAMAKLSIPQLIVNTDHHCPAEIVDKIQAIAVA